MAATTGFGISAIAVTAEVGWFSPETPPRPRPRSALSVKYLKALPARVPL